MEARRIADCPRHEQQQRQTGHHTGVHDLAPQAQAGPPGRERDQHRRHEEDGLPTREDGQPEHAAGRGRPCHRRRSTPVVGGPGIDAAIMAQKRPSGIPMPSITHRFGYTAAMPAAMSPARRPANSRPMSPTNRIVRLPAMQAITLWANHESAPTRFDTTKPPVEQRWMDGRRHELACTSACPGGVHQIGTAPLERLAEAAIGRQEAGAPGGRTTDPPAFGLRQGQVEQREHPGRETRRQRWPAGRHRLRPQRRWEASAAGRSAASLGSAIRHRHLHRRSMPFPVRGISQGTVRNCGRRWS